LSQAKIVGANLSNAICKDSIWAEAECSRSDLTRTDFRDSNLQSARFVEATLEATDLRRCVLNGASFNLANLSKANIWHAGFDQGTNLADAKLAQANLRTVTGLTCDQLTKAQDWAAAYRDPALACGAAVLDPDATSGNTSEHVEPTDTLPLLENLFGTQLSQWRDDVPESERHAQLEKSRQALLELEHALTNLRTQPERGQMGHNMPPEPMIGDKVLDQFIAEVRAGIALHDAPHPAKPRLIRLREVLDRFRKWLQPRIDTGADSAAKTLGVAAAMAATALFAKLSGAWEQLGALIAMLF
ncbi:MAG: pentapeptide repeat-containing protein, partial [Alphaproteobacteria bacterium]